MKTVFVLIYNPESIAESSRGRGTVYSVFEDKETAEAMKRTGDTVAEAPYFETDRQTTLMRIVSDTNSTRPLVTDKWEGEE